MWYSLDAYVVHTGCTYMWYSLDAYVVLTGCTYMWYSLDVRICGTHWMHMWYSLDAYVVLTGCICGTRVMVPGATCSGGVCDVFVMCTVRVCRLTRHVPIHQVNMHTHMYLFCVYVCVGDISYYARTYLDITYKCSVD